MGRLIDANALLSEMEKYSDDTAISKNDYLFGMQQRLETCIELVEDAPTVDAVPVVRCKDCKHYQFANNRAFGFPVKRCKWTGYEDIDDYDFCSAGRRKDGEQYD